MNTIHPLTRSLTGAGFACAFAGASLFGQPADEPLENFLAVDGSVFAIAETNQVLYLGGLFTAVGPRVGGGAPVSPTTGQVEPVFPRVNGAVRQAISDEAGGWFVAGSFTRVGNFVRTNLAHIRADRTVDPTWQPSAAGGSVSALVLTGGNLYFGGSFTNVNGQARSRLAAVSSSSGVLLGWNPNADAAVNAMGAFNGTIYIGGSFGSIGGVGRAYLGAVDAESGLPTPWNPGVGGTFGTTDDVLTLLVSNGRLFVGGYFTSLSGQTRSRLGSFDLSSGMLDGWDPNIGSITIVQPTVFALATDGNNIFAGGTFTLVGASNIVNLAAIDPATGFATAWNAQADPLFSSGFPTASVSALAVFNRALYVGGNLGHMGGQLRPYAAALDLLTGNATGWDPRPNMIVSTFAGSDTGLYIGGAFSALATVPRHNAAAYDLAAKQVTSWNPDVLGTGGNSFPVTALLPAYNQLFIGGAFTNAGGLTRTNLAAVDLNSGAGFDWAPNPNFQVYALATWQDRLYVGGSFTNIAGASRMNLAEFDLNTGALTSWDFGLNRGLVRTLTVGGDTLYVGGLVRTVYGVPHRGVAAYDLVNGVSSPWDAGIAGSPEVDGIAVVGSHFFAAGRFSVVAGFNRTNYFGIDTDTGQMLPAADADSFVYGLAADTNLVVIAGNFQNLAGQKRSYIGAFNPETGALTSWNPNADFYAQTVSIIRGTLYVGGVFISIGGQTSRGIAAFPLTQTASPPFIIPNSYFRHPDGSVQFQISAPGAAQVTVQTSADLVQWNTLQTVAISNGTGSFNDPSAGQYPHRFYRASVP